MPANAIYFDREFLQLINPGRMGAGIARSYTRATPTHAILAEMYTDMVASNGFNTLNICFHGAVVNNLIDSRSGTPYRVTGLGIRIGHDLLTYDNMELLRPFHSGARQIMLFSCNIAGAGGASFRPIGEPTGMDFCRRMAQITNTPVYASSDSQIATWVDTNFFNGTVYLFNPNGSHIMVQNLMPE